MVQNRLQQTIFMIESMVKKLDEIAKFRLNRLFLWVKGYPLYYLKFDTNLMNISEIMEEF